MSTIKTVATCLGVVVVTTYTAFAGVCAVAVIFPGVGNNTCVPEAEATVADLYDATICEE